MKISIVTITCRHEPRYREMEATIAANVARVQDVDLEWLIVDELGRDFESDSIDVRMVRPQPSEWRDRGFPDPQTARNTALSEVRGDYVVFLDDCTIVNNYWLEQVIECANNGWGYRCNVVDLSNTKLPIDGAFVWPHASPDRFRTCLATTVAGRCFGAPNKALCDIGGFDMIYSGGMPKGAMDAFVRTERAGLIWKTNRRGWAIQLTCTHDRAAVGRRDHDVRNKGFFDALLSDRERTDVIEAFVASTSADIPPEDSIPSYVTSAIRVDDPSDGASKATVSSMPRDPCADDDGAETDASPAVD